MTENPGKSFHKIGVRKSRQITLVYIFLAMSPTHVSSIQNGI